MDDAYLRAAAVGAICGIRSMAGPAIVSCSLRHQDLDGSSLRFTAGETFSLAAMIVAAGEMLADKTPWIPDRISAGPLIGRALSGALCGSALSSWKGRSPRVGAVIGIAAAVAAAFTFFHLRKVAGQYAPDPLLGIAEDVLVVVGGSRLVVLNGRKV